MTIAESFGPDPRIKIVSEKDKGIYDAMNRASKRAKGEWLVYMNAGDYFYDATILQKFDQFKKGEAGLIYGNFIADFGYHAHLSKPADLSAITRKNLTTTKPPSCGRN